MCGVDPRLCPQPTGTKNKNYETMEATKKGTKITGTGEIGSPRPDMEEIVRVSSRSLSVDRRREQADAQDCPAKNTTGETRKRRETSPAAAVFVSEDESDTDDWTPPRREAAKEKRKKRLRPCKSDELAQRTGQTGINWLA